jgi:hypothetical protein
MTNHDKPEINLDYKGATLREKVRENVDPSAILMTDKNPS